MWCRIPVNSGQAGSCPHLVVWFRGSTIGYGLMPQTRSRVKREPNERNHNGRTWRKRRAT